MFTLIFLAALLASVLVKMWLAQRQIRHVVQHRAAVPLRFEGAIPLSAHQKAADYTVARSQLGILETVVEAAFLVALTLLGGLQWIDNALFSLLPANWGGVWHGVTLVLAVMLVSGVVDLPFSLYRQFRLETRFGFNRMTFRLFIADTLRGMLLGLVLGVPLLGVILWLMGAAGPWWWLYAWLVMNGYLLFVQILFPTVIAPLYNKFSPLEDVALKERIDALLARCGFTSKGVFVMDGSRRSAHGNAYFTGFGASKRIVFYDTLLARLSPAEIEAVLAHELGHFKKRHVLKRMLWSFVTSLIGLGLLGWLASQGWFYSDLGIEPALASRDAVALMLFFFVLPSFTFPLSPLFSLASRKQEFEADAFAAANADSADLVQALVKLYEDNASTLTPDPLHSAFYDSHPPATLRIARLDGALRSPNPA